MSKRRLRVGVLDVESGHLHGSWFEEQLTARWPDLEVALKALGSRPRRAGRSGQGRRIPIREFYSEPIYRALVDGKIDIGVHRMKDLPAPLPDDVQLVAVTERKTPLDVLVTADGSILDELPAGARIGVSSRRREAQLNRYRRDLSIEFIVGTLSERLEMVTAGKLDGVVIAAAGIEWRGWQERVAEVFTAQVCLPAVGQAALGILVGAGAAEGLVEKLRFLNEPLSRQEVDAERAYYVALGAWEGSPVGGLARVKGDILRIDGCVCSLDGREILRAWAEGFPDDPLRTGERLAQQLLEQGAGEMLARAREEVGIVG
ncbi:MAG: hydroxymethylbilane synthase [Candidatus Eisenbacteria sp.]|nr:hydroxymethylbilane synthase [Candidatus Eisenbacteria bacterium]